MRFPSSGTKLDNSTKTPFTTSPGDVTYREEVRWDLLVGPASRPALALSIGFSVRGLRGSVADGASMPETGHVESSYRYVRNTSQISFKSLLFSAR